MCPVIQIGAVLLDMRGISGLGILPITAGTTTARAGTIDMAVL